MTKWQWQATADIVKTLADRDRPGLAVIALSVIIGLPSLIGGAIYLLAR